MFARARTLMTLTAAAMTGLVLFAASASAELIVIADPASQVTTSTEISACCGDRDPSDLADGSGLVAGLHDVDPGNMWLSEGSGFGAVDPDPWVLFDLGEEFTINSFHVWNYNEIGAFATRGVDGVSVEYGSTAALGSTVAGITSFAQASGAAGDAGEEISGFTPFNARFIKFDIDSNYGDANTFYGLSEVQFDGVAVPEPSTWILAGIGALGLAVITRRRRV